MKRLLLASSVGFALASGSALAADMAVKAPLAPPPVYSWTGCYIDGGAGYGVGNQDHYAETFPGLVALEPTTTAGGRGWLGRVGGGCDYQAGSRWVIGVFADYDAMNLKGTVGDPLFGTQGSGTETAAWAAGGRIGYLITPELLTYFDGGYTASRTSQVNLFTAAIPPVATGFDVAAATHNGWFLGAGDEYALDFAWLPIHGLFWRNEYRYASYQAANDPIVVIATGALSGLAAHTQGQVQTITTSLVWRFNWPGPISTRY